MISIITAAHLVDEQDVAWLQELGKSILEQPGVWEWIIVNDHSDVGVPVFGDERVRFIDSRGSGVSNTRNTGAHAARYPLLLFVDHDDLLAEGALAKYLAGYKIAQAKEEKRLGWVIYPDTLIIQANSQRHFASPEYTFDGLLRNLIMPIGSLHSKAAFLAVNGFKPEMEAGLEDWEYWISLGEVGVCGYHVAEPLYIYRFHARGRRAALHKNDGMAKAQARMRDMHQKTYKGEQPPMCCGKSVSRPRAKSVPQPAVAMAQATSDDWVQIRYVGKQRGFWVVGKATGIRYYIQEPGAMVRRGQGAEGVHRNDIPVFTQYGSNVFQVL